MSASEHEGGVVVHVADRDLAFRTVRLDDATPTGHQIAHAAGCRPAQDAVVLRMLEDGDVALVRPDEMVDLRHGGDHRFIVGIADHVSLLRIDGERLEWIGGIVSGAALRRLGRVPDDHEILLQRIDQPDREIAPTDLVSLDREGIEDFVTRKRAWKLNVHGVVVEFDVPRLKVRDALVKARFDPAKPWQIFLKVAGQPKREVQLDDVIDLTTPGIEKLRLMPRAVDNGEAPVASRRLFGLLGEDVEYLDRLGLRWETVVEEARRWLLVRDYPLPPGFTAAKSDIAFEIPPTYPQTQLYGFYFNPPLALASGRTIPSTQLSGVIDRRSFVGWSRYRPGQPWNPDADNVVTQFALAEACLLKEVGE